MDIRNQITNFFPLKYDGSRHKTLYSRYELSRNKNYYPKDVEEFAQNETRLMKEKLGKNAPSYEYSVSVMYRDITLHPMCSHIPKPLGEKVHINTYSDSPDCNVDEKLKGFDIVYIALPPQSDVARYSTRYSDCVYLCIVKLLYGDEPPKEKKLLPIEIRTPKKLKEWFKVERMDGIPIERVPELENIMTDYAINITGEYKYVSPYNETRNKQLNMRFKDNHIKPTKTAIKYKFIKDIKMKPVKKENVYSYSFVPDGVEVFKGNETVVITPEEYWDIMKKKNVLMICDMNDNKPLKEIRDEFIRKADIFNETSDFNMYKYNTYGNMCLDIWRQMTRIKLDAPEPIDEIEAEALIAVSHGGLNMCLKGEFDGCELDINSFYSSIVLDPHFNFPIKKPKLRTLTQKKFDEDEMEFNPYGIYHAHIERGNPLLNRFFKFTNDYYTHYDLMVAKLFDFKARIIEGQTNLYEYSMKKEDRANGKELFSEFVNYFYEMKRDATNDTVKEISKTILNSLIGVFQKKRKFKYVINDEHPRTLGRNQMITSIKQIGEFTMEDIPLDFSVSVINKKHIFKYDWARILFLTSYARYRLIKSLLTTNGKLDLEKVKHIKRIATDSFICDMKYEEAVKFYGLDVGKELGQWKIGKYEGMDGNFKQAIGKCKIVHQNMVLWNEWID